MSKRCSAKNRSGKRCGAWAVRGATQCALHSDPERAAEMGSRHGRKVRFRSLPDALAPPAQISEKHRGRMRVLRRNN